MIKQIFIGGLLSLLAIHATAAGYCDKDPRTARLGADDVEIIDVVPGRWIQFNFADNEGGYLVVTYLEKYY